MSALTQIRYVYGMEVGSERGRLLKRCKWKKAQHGKADDVEFVSLLGNQDLTVAAWLRTYYALKRKLQKKTMKKEEKEVERHLR